MMIKINFDLKTKFNDILSEMSFKSNSQNRYFNRNKYDFVDNHKSSNYLNPNGLQILFGPKYWAWNYDASRLFYITPYFLSKQMARYADFLYNKRNDSILDNNDRSMICWDMFSGIGTDAVYLSSYFSVIASEIDANTYQLLLSNVQSFNLKNVNCIKSNCISLVDKIKPDVIYYDPPWGESYRSKNKNFDFNHVYIDYPVSGTDDLPKKVSCTDLVKYIFRNVCKNIIIKSPMNSSTFDKIFAPNLAYVHKCKNKNLKFLFVTERNNNIIHDN